MNLDSLRGFIARLGNWINVVDASGIPEGRPGIIDVWKGESDASGRLLQRDSEIPIAFLGPSQQGKSTLINALLGENILAVGGAVGACTCVITSVHYSLQKGYKAEIDFISTDDWRSELISIADALTSGPCADDDVSDQEETRLSREAAFEKFASIYQKDPTDTILSLLDDPQLGLPVQIFEAMSVGQPMSMVETSAQGLRNNVRRYLVGREQHKDGQYWPLISRVRIFGQFPILENGVTLVDLPGLNDPNPAREQVTKRYLADARHLWLICNSQTGIDRVFTQILREQALLFKLFIEGRLDAFSVIATRLDDLNLEVILSQMGVDPDDFDGDHSCPLAFRRDEILRNIQDRLRKIAEDIAEKADDAPTKEDFFQRVGNIPVFSVSTSAYLHSIGKMPLYRGMTLTSEQSGLPDLIQFLGTITAERSYETQVESSRRRLKALHGQIRRFFLARIHEVRLDSEAAKNEWKKFDQVARSAIAEGLVQLRTTRTRRFETLDLNCRQFENRLKESECRAASVLEAVLQKWNAIHWRSLRSITLNQGAWFSRSTQRSYDLNHDLANAYLGILALVWDQFFSAQLSQLVNQVAADSKNELRRSAERVHGALSMLSQQPEGILQRLQDTLKAAETSFELQVGEITARLVEQIKRTRQQLSSGVIETAAHFMKEAYDEAACVEIGQGVKARMLNVLDKHARSKSPVLFIGIRSELISGLGILQTSLRSQLDQLVAYGEKILTQLEQNLSTVEVSPPQVARLIEQAMLTYPEFPQE